MPNYIFGHITKCILLTVWLGGAMGSLGHFTSDLKLADSIIGCSVVTQWPKASRSHNVVLLNKMNVPLFTKHWYRHGWRLSVARKLAAGLADSIDNH